MLGRILSELVSDFLYIVRIEPDGTLVPEWVNEAFSRITGFTLEDMEARGGWHSLVHPDDLEIIARSRQILLSGQSDISEFRILTKDGTTRWLRNYARPVQHKALHHANRAYGAAQDITLRRETQEALKESLAQVERAKQEWESTADSLSQIICLLDDRGRIVRVNRAVENWGLGSIAEVKGQELHSLLHPSCRGPDCSLSSFWGSAWEALLEGRSTGCECEANAPDRYLHIQVQPILGQTGFRSKETASFAVVIVEDISERKKAEEALRQHTTELQARNEELDAFAHTVAHDLKNPLSLTIGFADLLTTYQETTDYGKQKEILQAIMQNSLRMSNIIDELLLLAQVRKQDVQTKPLNMTRIVSGASGRLAHMIEEFTAQLILPDTWPVAVGYAPWVEEVWVNYLSNGIKYGGRPPRLELGAEKEPGGVVRFWVSDNGRGLAQEDQARLFIPFTRLNQVRATGHGLGLSITRRIVEKLGGRVEVESEIGRGSVFSFTLPQDPNSDQ